MIFALCKNPVEIKYSKYLESEYTSIFYNIQQ